MSFETKRIHLLKTAKYQFTKKHSWLVALFLRHLFTTSINYLHADSDAYTDISCWLSCIKNENMESLALFIYFFLFISFKGEYISFYF